MLNSYYYTDGLESQRMRSRFLTEEDISVWTRFYAFPEATLYIPNYATDDPQKKSEFIIQKQLNRYKERTYGLQAMYEKTSGELLGLCGLLTQEVEGLKELEIGYHFLFPHWGKGYATEAAKLFKQFATDHSLADSVTSIIHIHNTRSQAVAMRNGMTADKELHWSGFDVVIYRCSLPLNAAQ